jgi:enamine deaminase RidA (YjgF/YER057c/UK114 family)
MTKQAIISSNLAPLPGPFSAAIRAGDYIYFNGQIGQVPAGRLIEGGVERQTQQVLEDLPAVLTPPPRASPMWFVSAFSPTRHRLAQ